MPESWTVRGFVVVVLASCAHSVPPASPARPTRLAPSDATHARPDDKPSWIGLRLEPGTLRVAQVMDPAPASRAGVQTGDEVRTVDGAAVANADDFIRRMMLAKAGTNVVLGLVRSGTTISLSVQPETRPDPSAMLDHTLLNKQAPSFELPVVSGPASGKLADHAGHVVVVEFWATWCKPCAITMPRLNAWHTKDSPRGLVVLGISDEEAPLIAKYATDHQVLYTLVRDADSKVAARYLRMAVPLLVVIDKHGMIRYAGMGAGDFERVESIIEAALRE